MDWVGLGWICCDLTVAETAAESAKCASHESGAVAGARCLFFFEHDVFSFPEGYSATEDGRQKDRPLLRRGYEGQVFCLRYFRRRPLPRLRACLENGWRGRLAQPGRRLAARNGGGQRGARAIRSGLNRGFHSVRRVAGRHRRVACATHSSFSKHALNPSCPMVSPFFLLLARPCFPGAVAAGLGHRAGDVSGVRSEIQPKRQA